MANSLREQIADAALAVVSPLFAAPEGAVHRSLLTPLSRGVARAAKVDWTEEQCQRLTQAGDECALTLHLAVMVRAQDGAEAEADEHITAAHALLMAERTLGGLCSDIELVAAGKTGAANEQETVEIVHQYRITYRRRTADIAQK